jgi:ribose transport system substrate-binding protein
MKKSIPLFVLLSLLCSFCGVAQEPVPVSDELPKKLSHEEVAAILGAQIGQWKLKGRESPVGGEPVSYQGTNIVRWKEEGKSIEMRSNGIQEGKKKFSGVGHKEYDHDKGVFIFRFKPSDQPERLAHERYDPTTATFYGQHVSPELPNHVKISYVFRKVDADHFVFRLKVRENDSLVFEVEAEETRQVIGEARESKLRIAFVTNMIADFWNIAKSGCLDAQRDLGVEVVVKMPPQFSVVLQKQIVEALIADGIDGIAISPLDASNQTAWLNGIAAQVPLITHDSDAPESKRRVYLGMDNYKAGRMCGELVKEALPNGGGVMLFIGRLGQDMAKQRRQGVIDELFGRPVPESHDKIAHDPVEDMLDGGKYKILGTAVTGFVQARQKADDAIVAYPDMKAMVGLFEYNPPACYKALKQAGKLGKIKLVGFDENNVTLQGIKEGFVTGTIVQNPYQLGYQSIKVLKDIIEGKDNLDGKDYFDVVGRKITKENVEAYWTDLKARKTDN